jgi:hypothetical protein
VWNGAVFYILSVMLVPTFFNPPKKPKKRPIFKKSHKIKKSSTFLLFYIPHQMPQPKEKEKWSDISVRFNLAVRVLTRKRIFLPQSTT